MKRQTRWILSSLVLITLGGAHAAELTVSAAASLAEAFKEIGRAFESRHPGDKILFNFAASDTLVQQIAKGAPVDVFASADQDAMDQAQSKNLLLTGTRAIFALNRLVLIVPKDASPVKQLSDLKNAAIKRIAIGNPDSVPAGRYARTALERATIWQALQTKLIMAQNVRQALEYVARGEVDAGFVYATDAAILHDKVSVAMQADTGAPITYPIAAISGSRNPVLTTDFIAWVKGAESRAILQRYGFSVP